MKKMINQNLIVFTVLSFVAVISASCQPNNVAAPVGVSEELVSGDLPADVISAELQQKINDLPHGVSDAPDHSDYLTPEYFDLVRSYIKELGDSTVVDVSGNGSGKWLVTYHEIFHNGWNITVDHTDRIYFSTVSDSLHYGNILYNRDFQNLLYEDNKVVVEMTYGIGRDQTQAEIEEDNKKAKILREEYNLLVEGILNLKRE